MKWEMKFSYTVGMVAAPVLLKSCVLLPGGIFFKRRLVADVLLFALDKANHTQTTPVLLCPGNVRLRM